MDAIPVLLAGDCADHPGRTARGMDVWPYQPGGSVRHGRGMTDVSEIGSFPITALAADEVAHIEPDATLEELAAALRDADVSLLAVTDGDELVGVASERDVAHAIADGRAPRSTTARDVASSSIVWVDATATVAEVANLMMEQYVRHVLVEDDGTLVGVVSARDLLGAYAAADLPDFQ